MTAAEKIETARVILRMMEHAGIYTLTVQPESGHSCHLDSGTTLQDAYPNDAAIIDHESGSIPGHRYKSAEITLDGVHYVQTGAR